MNYINKQLRLSKILLVIGISFGLFGLFGKDIILHIMPDYKTYNKEIVKDVFRKLDKNNPEEVYASLLLYIESNEFYMRNRRAMSAIGSLGFILLIVSLFMWLENRVSSIEIKQKK